MHRIFATNKEVEKYNKKMLNSHLRKVISNRLIEGNTIINDDKVESPTNLLQEEKHIFNLQDLPDLVLINVFSFLNPNDKYACSKVSQRLQKICTEKSFWKKVVLSHQKNVPSGLIAHAVFNGCQSLDLSHSTYIGNSTFLGKSEIKSLDLRQCFYHEPYADHDFLPNLVKSCTSLEKLSLNQRLLSQFSQGICKNGSTLTSLNLAGCSDIDVCLEAIINNCNNLLEASFSGELLCKYSISFICRNLTTNIRKLSLENQTVHDKDIDNLVKRCVEIEELNLGNCTDITKRAVISIANNLSQLKKLQLSECIDYDGLNALNSMKNLKYLWIPPNNRDVEKNRNSELNRTFNVEEDSSWHNENLRLLLPHVILNQGVFDIFT